MAREPVVFCGDKEGYESGLSQNRMYFVLMRKNMRLGGRELYVLKAGYETVWPENRVYFVVMRKNMRLGGREPDVLKAGYENEWP